jgi:hypothetical protein
VKAEKSMKVVLQVAVGVFLGGIALFLVFRFWGMLGQKSESLVLPMTPESLISKCGKPLSDTEDTGPRPYRGTRTMEYKRADGIHEFLSFVWVDKTTVNLTPAENPNGEWGFGGMKDMAQSYETRASQVQVLPCLDSK